MNQFPEKEMPIPILFSFSPSLFSVEILSGQFFFVIFSSFLSYNSYGKSSVSCLPKPPDRDIVKIEIGQIIFLSSIAFQYLDWIDIYIYTFHR